MSAGVNDSSEAQAQRTAGGTRLQAFVDAAFAFAVTLLVLTTSDAIPRDTADFVAALRRIPAFAMSFALISMFWYAHVQWSQRFGLRDGWSTFFSFALVFTVLVFVYPLRAMAGSFIAFATGGALPADVALEGFEGFRVLVMTFGLAYLTMSTLMASLYWRACRVYRKAPALTPADRDAAAEARSRRTVWIIQAGSALLSFICAASGVPSLVSISPWWYSLLAVILPVYGYWQQRRWAAESAAAAG